MLNKLQDKKYLRISFDSPSYLATQGTAHSILINPQLQTFMLQILSYEAFSHKIVILN